MHTYLLWAVVRRLKCNRLAIWLAAHLPYHTIDLSEYSAEDIVQKFSEYSPQSKTSCIAPSCYHNENKYDLDIIIPVYKTEKTIRKCLDSVLKQKTSYAIRVICVDDGSPDNAGKILDEYAESDSRVYVVHQENRGYSGARNRGLELVNAKYIMFVDSDDYLEKNSIEKLLENAKREKSDIIVSGYHLVNKDGKILSTVQHEPKHNKGSVQTLGYMWATLWKSSLFTGIRYPEGYWYEDGVNWIVLSRLAHTCYWSDVISYNYLQNTEGITNLSLYSKKSVDTVLVCWQLINDAKNLSGIRPWDVTGYEDFLMHVKVSERRLRFQSRIIQKEAFIFFCLLYEKYFKKFESKELKWTLLERSLSSRNELLYHMFCELI